MLPKFSQDSNSNFWHHLLLRVNFARWKNLRELFKYSSIIKKKFSDTPILLSDIEYEFWQRGNRIYYAENEYRVYTARDMDMDEDVFYDIT